MDGVETAREHLLDLSGPLLEYAEQRDPASLIFVQP
jgi:hypothetical protein